MKKYERKEAVGVRVEKARKVKSFAKRTGKKGK